MTHAGEPRVDWEDPNRLPIDAHAPRVDVPLTHAASSTPEAPQGAPSDAARPTDESAAIPGPPPSGPGEPTPPLDAMPDIHAMPDTDPMTDTAPNPDSDPAPGSDAPSLFPAPPLAEQERMVEAILFAATDPVTLRDMAKRMPAGCDPARAVADLRRRYAGRGVTIERIGDAWAMRTAPDLAFLMRHETVETRKLSRAAIETLAIVAYHQPVTRAEIEEIRGVAVSRGTVDQLIDLDWIRFGRRKMTPGRPVTYVVTQAFLDHFGLSSARDLPGLAELRAAGLLDSRPAPEAAEDSDDQAEMFAADG